MCKITKCTCVFCEKEQRSDSWRQKPNTERTGNTTMCAQHQHQAQFSENVHCQSASQRCPQPLWEKTVLATLGFNMSHSLFMSVFYHIILEAQKSKQQPGTRLLGSLSHFHFHTASTSFLSQTYSTFMQNQYVKLSSYSSHLFEENNVRILLSTSDPTLCPDPHRQLQEVDI